jgi:hypothetical protein
MKTSAGEQSAMKAAGRDRRSRRARGARWLAVGVAALFAVGALPAAAGATDYCVAPTTACGGTTVNSLEQALDQADNAADADRIFLGAATYTAPTASGYTYSSTYPVEIIGNGTGETILTSPPGASTVFAFHAGAGSLVHDLTIRLPQNAANGHMGLVTSNAARWIEVIEHQTQSNPRSGVGLGEGATLEDSRVTLAGAPYPTVAVELADSEPKIRRSTLSAWTAVKSYGGTIERSRLIGTDAGVAAQGGVTALGRSVVRLTEGNGVGIYASAASGSHTVLNADGVTIVGPGLANTDAADVFNGFAPAEAVDLSLTNSIIRGFEHPLRADAAGSGQAKIAISYSDYDPSGNATSGGPNAVIAEANVSNVGDAGFVDPTGGDFRLLPGSPLLDTGDPATPQGLDLDGNPLVADGNADGSARRDLGAYELQPAAGGQPGTGGGSGADGAGGGAAGGGAAADVSAPVLARLGLAAGRRRVAQASRLSLARARRLRLVFVANEPATVKIVARRLVDGRLTKARGSIVRSVATGKGSIALGRDLRRLGALRPGQLRLIVTATDTAGNRSARRVLKLRLRA